MMKRLTKKYGQWWQLYLFLLIPLIYIIVFKYVPMTGLQIAFRKYKAAQGIWGSAWVGMKNFERFFQSYQFSNVLRNTLILSGYSIFVGFPFPIIFALMLNTVTSERAKKLVQTITYMPHFISTVVLVGMILQIFNVNYGVYGQIYKALTGTRASDLMATGAGFTHIYVWSGIWQNFGWDSIMYLAALTAVSEELHEAAQIDGATRLQRVMHIDLPAILPTITIMLIMRAGSIMSVGFEKVYLMQNDLNIAASEIISTYEYKRGLASGGASDFSLSTAIGLFNSAINFVLIVVVNKICSKLSDTSLW